MPKTCDEPNCNNPRWSRATGKCKFHTRFDKPKPVSIKQKKNISEYSKIRKEYMKEHPNCKVCGKEATDVHHKYKRLSGALLDTDTWISICRACHSHLHDNPEEAKQKGLLATQEQIVQYLKNKHL